MLHKQWHRETLNSQKGVNSQYTKEYPKVLTEMLNFYNLVALFSALLYCVLQVLASMFSTHTVINTISINYFKDCPSVAVIRRANTTNGSSSMWLGDDGYEGYLEICTYSNPGTQWRPVCDGELWTDTEARVACNQLGYPNTTTLGR